MSRHLTRLISVLIFVAGCSNNPERTSSALPTGPTTSAAPAPGSLLGDTPVAPGGVSGKHDVSFPGRNDSFDFRNQLETKYQTSLGRSAAPTFVDREGEVVWTQEYMRYRVNGCSHAAAVALVMTQVGGGAAGAVCGASASGLIEFPPRTDAFDFRRQLETRYQQFNRGASSSTVDAEGGVIWTQEYLRYRVNSCDHATSVQKVFTQIDGGGVPATCYVAPCIFSVPSTAQAVPTAGGTFTVTVSKTSGESCSYQAESLDPAVTITGGATGTSLANTVTYSVAPNFGTARTMMIRVRWTGGSTLYQIDQAAGTAVAFTLTDPNVSSSATTNCNIKLTNTPCRLDVSSGTFSSNAIYSWHVDYQYGGTASHDFTTTNSSFTFTQTCGGPGATAGGTSTALNVTLTVTDGNTTVTVQSGAGGQPGLTITFFSC